ncbi:CsbD family protein [Bryobacter aggregatus]|uniref:CsbD family protein n=1 Tax=Bryobacter aggregatus TaxID=360054 RepID=UPI0004E1379F|nr:CsbD family protein [Bryobacter aggregatus]
MNTEQLRGDWEQLKGKIKQQWGHLTEDDLTVAQGKAEELAGKVQERYGIAKEEATRQVNDFLKKHQS